MKLQPSLLLLFICLIFSIAGNSQAPTFEWAIQNSGPGRDYPLSIATDANGNIYTTGSFINTADFDPGPGMFSLISKGGRDIYILKLNPSGNLIWVKQMGGLSGDAGNSITVDNNGNIYTTGLFSDTVDFDPGPGVYNLTSYGGSDIFIQKLDSNGNFLWVKQMGGFNSDGSYSITTDLKGNVYTTGLFRDSIDIDPGVRVIPLFSRGQDDIFIQKLDANGNFVWGKHLGGLDIDFSNSISTDGSGKVYTAGIFKGTVDFDPGVGVHNLTSLGNYDAFIQKLDSNGNFLWVKQMGGIGYEFITTSVDAKGYVYSTGEFEDTVDFDPGLGITNLISKGYDDIYIQKLDSRGNLVWIKQIGGLVNQKAGFVISDIHENTYTTGGFNGTVDFDPGPGVYNLTSYGGSDIFIQKLDSSGNFKWAKRMGGIGNDDARSLTIDLNENIYTTGNFTHTVDFDPDTGIANLTAVAIRNNIFIQKLSQTLPVGLQENGVSDQIVGYPNPTEGPINIRFDTFQEQLTVRLFSITGQELMSKDFLNSKEVTLELNQPSGLYLLELTDNQGSKRVLKVLKK